MRVILRGPWDEASLSHGVSWQQTEEFYSLTLSSVPVSPVGNRLTSMSYIFDRVLSEMIRTLSRNYSSKIKCVITVLVLMFSRFDKTLLTYKFVCPISFQDR